MEKEDFLLCNLQSSLPFMGLKEGQKETAGERRRVMRGYMGWKEQQAVTLGHVLVGALNPGGCSHTQLFVVFVLHSQARYFPEPGRRISVAWPPSPAAHMTSAAGKPRMMAQKEVHHG